MPAKAGIHRSSDRAAEAWVPACAGTAKEKRRIRRNFGTGKLVPGSPVLLSAAQPTNPWRQAMAGSKPGHRDEDMIVTDRSWA